jgi:hypothetical protein
MVSLGKKSWNKSSGWLGGWGRLLLLNLDEDLPGGVASERYAESHGIRAHHVIVILMISLGASRLSGGPNQTEIWSAHKGEDSDRSTKASLAQIRH